MSSDPISLPGSAERRGGIITPTETLSPDQKAFLEYVQRTSEGFAVYGSDASRLFMVQGFKKKDRSEKSDLIQRVHYAPSNPETNSLYLVFPFDIKNAVWFFQEEKEETTLRSITNDNNGQRVQLGFESGCENVTFHLGEEHVDLTYLKGLFSYVTLLGRKSRPDEAFQTSPLTVEEVGKRVPELKWHDIAYSPDGKNVLFRPFGAEQSVSFPISINKPLIIGSLISPELFRDPTNPNPDIDSSWLNADLLGLWGIKFRPEDPASRYFSSPVA